MVNSSKLKAVTNEKEIYSIEWNKIYFYIWGEFEKKWPYFSKKKMLKDVSFGMSLSRYVRPEETRKDILISLIKENIENPALINITKLNFEENIAPKISWVWELGHMTHIFWNIKYDQAHLLLKPRDEFVKNPIAYINNYKKRYGVEFKDLELISYFSENARYKVLADMQDLVYKEFRDFEKKWHWFFNEEVKKAKMILEKIINDMFEDDGQLKKDFYIK